MSTVLHSGFSRLKAARLLGVSHLSFVLFSLSVLLWATLGFNHVQAAAAASTQAAVGQSAQVEEQAQATRLAGKTQLDLQTVQDVGKLQQILNEFSPEPPKGTPVLSVFTGRSQLVEFKQSIARVALANPELAEVVPLKRNLLMINGKAPGVTSLGVWSREGHEALFNLSVMSDYSAFLQAAQALAPDEALDLKVVGDSLLVRGQLSSTVLLDEIKRLAGAYGFPPEKVIDLSETPAPQVSLSVKIAEASRSTLKDFRVGLALRGDNQIGFTKIDTLPPTGTAVNIGQLAAGNTSNVGGIVGALTPDLGSDFNLDARFDLLEQSGKVRILAEPTLVCTHDQEASFLAGGEFPFIVGIDQNGNPIIEFKEFGVRLIFTPHVLMRSGRIQLKVIPEVSQLDTTTTQVANGQQVFGLLSRRTETTVELLDGNSLMISGLLSRNESETLSKIPWAGDLPVLGPLFRNRNNDKEDRELIVIITPTILPSETPPAVLGAN